MNEKKLCIGYIGFGNSVIRYHLPYVRMRKHIHVKTVYRREEDRLSDMEREHLYPQIKFTSDLNELLQDPEIDVVCINSPNPTHAFYAEQALRSGKHILVEKPFALNSRDAQRIFSLAQEKGLLAYTNQNRRYDADFLVLKDVLESGKLGTLIELESHYDYFKSRPVVTQDMIFNLGIHTIDQMVALFGIPEKTRFDVKGILNDGPAADDYFDLELYYGKFKASVKTSLFVKLPYPRFLVHGTTGSFMKYSQGHLFTKSAQEPIEASFEQESEENWGVISYVDEYGNDITTHIPSRITDYGRIYDDLYACVFQGKKPYVRADEVIAVLKIAEEAVKAAKE